MAGADRDLGAVVPLVTGLAGDVLGRVAQPGVTRGPQAPEARQGVTGSAGYRRLYHPAYDTP
jgi:hypothetical protein